jgi:uncharacterized membrane protein YsdA (DUF1294 family)
MGCGLISLLLAIAIAIALYYGLQWPCWLAWLAPINGVTFIAYRFDKWKARKAESGKDRIPERVLHLLALVGGSPGAFLGMIVPPRHKTKDCRFQVYFWLIVLVQVGVVIWLWLSGHILAGSSIGVMQD